MSSYKIMQGANNR